MAKHRLITAGFILAGLINTVGALVFTEGFRNAYIAELSPEVFSTFGAIGVILWGLAYISVAGKHRQVRSLVAVFALQKLVFFGFWLHWLLRKDVAIAEIYGTSLITGVGLMSYGPNDLLFCLFFAWAWKQSKPGPR